MAEKPKVQGGLNFGANLKPKKTPVKYQEAPKPIEKIEDDIDMKDDVHEEVVQKKKAPQKESPVQPIYGEDESSQEVTTIKRKTRGKKRALVQESEEDEIPSPPKKHVDQPMANDSEDEPVHQKTMNQYFEKSSAEQSQSQTNAAFKNMSIKKKNVIKPGFKRVVKQRIMTDDKGYTVVEDYSSQEEMTKEEIEQKKKKLDVKKVQVTMPQAVAGKSVK